MSQITTHILDTMKGQPAASVNVILLRGENDEWTEITRGSTNKDGRIMELLPINTIVAHGIYMLRFETKDYYDSQQIATFYPYVDIVFDIKTNDHYHIPLLLSPFGYSTYRGS